MYSVFLCILLLLTNRSESELIPGENLEETVVSDIHYLIKLAQRTSVSCLIASLHSRTNVVMVYNKTILLLLSRPPLFACATEMLLILLFVIFAAFCGTLTGRMKKTSSLKYLLFIIPLMT